MSAEEGLERKESKAEVDEVIGEDDPDEYDDLQVHLTPTTYFGTSRRLPSFKDMKYWVDSTPAIYIGGEVMSAQKTCLSSQSFYATLFGLRFDVGGKS